MKENVSILTEHEFNLSDFALFLSVVKNPRAYQCMLSVFMEEPDIELAEVKVEQVILNKVGKRAIRLDAWAKSTDNRQFNMEMQNDTKGDDVRKRSRYYQGLLDSPILKSGKETRYKNLPSTVIIFITQEDIFGKDLAKYTFTEQINKRRGCPFHWTRVFNERGIFYARNGGYYTMEKITGRVSTKEQNECNSSISI